MAKTVKLNGTDCTSYFTPTGMQVTYEKVDGGNGGYMQSGVEEEDIIAWKAVVTLPCMPLTAAQQSTVLSAIRVNDPTLYYFDPHANAYRTIHIKASLKATKYRGVGGTGTEYWTGLVLEAKEK